VTRKAIFWHSLIEDVAEVHGPDSSLNNTGTRAVHVAARVLSSSDEPDTKYPRP